MSFIPDVPGRGAWTRRGGLLPGTPGSTSTRGYYRLAVGSETPIGSLVVNHAIDNDTYRSVWAGVQTIQRLVGATADGWFGASTDRLVRAVQAKTHVAVDGVVGPVTMQAALTAYVTDVAHQYGIPMTILGGLAKNESGLDPAAVGVNGWDHGLVQINLQAHPEVQWSNAMNASFSFHFAAASLIRVHDQWVGHTSADPWDIAIAYHNSPALAVEWADTGAPPVIAGRTIQIATYVKRVREAW